MKRIARRAKILTLVIVFFLGCMGLFFSDYAKGRERWVVHPANKNIYSNARLKGSGSIVSSDGTNLLTLDKNGTTYADDATVRKATLHAVGDPADNIVTGVMKSQKTKLIGYDLLNGVYSPTGNGNTINLSIDANLSKTAYEALGERKGTVAVYNYKTGKILCMVSKPSYDPNNIPDLTTDYYEGVYLNRAVGGLYVPGSVFKVVTMAAAIDTLSDLYTKEFYCNGGIEIEGQWVSCLHNHGKLDAKTAFAESCNAAFATLANDIGASRLAEYADKLGVTSKYDINGAMTARGRFNVEGASDFDLAWAGIGQHTTMVNPMQYMILMGAIANDGKIKSPYYIDNIKNSFGFPQSLRLPTLEDRLISEETAAQLKDLMRNNAKVSYHDDTFAGMELCAKSGTAEVDNGRPHAWFTGFLNNSDMPLAFVVVVENAGGGGANALPVARTVLKEAVQTIQK